MWYKISERGLIRFEDTANRMAEIIYPAIENILKKYKSEFQQIYKNFNTLKKRYDNLSEQEQKIELNKYNTFAKSLEKQIQLELEDTFNRARFLIKDQNIDNDFDIDALILPDNDWKAHYYNKLFKLSILNIESKEDLAETIEHELVHNKQFKNMPSQYTEKQKKKMLNTPYFDLKVEGPAFATNILRELPPLKNWLIEEFKIMKIKNPWIQFEDFAMSELNDLMSNSYMFQNYLNMSERYRIMMQGDQDREPIQKQYRRNKLNKILHEAISQQAREILSTL